MAAIISFNVVLPLLPVKPITGFEYCCRQPAARSANACLVSLTITCGSLQSIRWLTRAAPALSTKSATKSCASNRSPLIAIKRLSLNTFLESILTELIATSIATSTLYSSPFVIVAMSVSVNQLIYAPCFYYLVVHAAP